MGKQPEAVSLQISKTKGNLSHWIKLDPYGNQVNIAAEKLAKEATSKPGM